MCLLSGLVMCVCVRAPVVFLLACWCVHDCCDWALDVRCWAADGMLPASKKGMKGSICS